MPLASAGGAPVVIVNAGPTPYDHLAAVMVRGWIADVLPAVLPSP